MSAAKPSAAVYHMSVSDRAAGTRNADAGCSVVAAVLPKLSAVSREEDE